MTLTDRILPPAEWAKLEGLDLGVALQQLSPAHTQVIVVEDGEGQVVGCWSVTTVLHAEGLWIAPAYRGRTSVARRLWMRLRGIVVGLGARSVVTATNDEMITAMLEKRGTALPKEYAICLQ